MWEVRYLPEAAEELAKLPPKERAAVENGVRKLESLGPSLGYPHSSDIRDADNLRELRPRQGRSPWRPLYRKYDETTYVIAAISPEAENDPRGFSRSRADAIKRLADLE